MKLTVSTKPDAGAIAVRFFTTADRTKLPAGISELEFSLKPGSRVFLHAERMLCAGIGDAAKVSADTIRNAAGVAALALKKAGRTNFAVHIGDWPQFAAAAAEGIVLADYRCEDFKKSRIPAIDRVALIVRPADLAVARRAADRSRTIAEFANLVRGIANRPANVVYPETLAEEAAWHAKKLSLRCTVLDERKLRARRFGGIVAVGSGSARPPRLIMLEHRGGARGEAPLVLVGKAVTFDTGGISIKPAADMEKMIWDKCGGIAVLGAMLAIAKLGIRRNVVALIPAAENMPGPAAYRPGDIVSCFDGKAVEIINTDAEGRMLLADAIGFARQELKASAIVDVATLTGACGVALGDSVAGLWSSDDRLRDTLLVAGQDCGERLWPMPLFPEYDEQIRSEVALVKNSGGRMAGACTAAAFLKTFAEDTPWAHLDIAYTAFREKDSAALARGATGFAMRTLVELAARWK